MDTVSTVMYYVPSLMEDLMTATPPTNRLPTSLMNSIEEHIVAGEYPPGTRLEEVELAETFGVSRTPIREALIRLAATGMIERRPRKGWAVTEVSPSRLCEMFDVMAELGGDVWPACGPTRHDLPAAEIRAAHEACRGVSDADAYSQAPMRFHFAIYDASGNGYLVEKVREVQRQLRPFRRLQLRVKSRLADSFREHQGIVDAILAGDSASAAERLRAHVTVQGQRFSDLVTSLDHLSAKRSSKTPRRRMPARVG